MLNNIPQPNFYMLYTYLIESHMGGIQAVRHRRKYHIERHPHATYLPWWILSL